MKTLVVRLILTIAMMGWVWTAKDLLAIRFCLTLLVISNELHGILWKLAFKPSEGTGEK